MVAKDSSRRAGLVTAATTAAPQALFALPSGLSRLLRAYHLGPDHPMKLRLWGMLRRALGYRRLTIPYAGSGWITVDERDYVQQQIYRHGAYEPEVWETLAALLQPGDVLWDVGAHIGAISIQAALDPRVRRVHAFEPDPLQLAALRLNLRLNGIADTVHPYALSDQCETRQFFHGPAINSGMSGLTSRSDALTFTVACRTGDDVVYNEGCEAPTLMKIDVEGWEVYVLRGMARLLREGPPRGIVFESAAAEGRPADQALAALLAEHGYTVRLIPRREASPDRNENFVAIRR